MPKLLTCTEGDYCFACTAKWARVRRRSKQHKHPYGNEEVRRRKRNLINPCLTTRYLSHCTIESLAPPRVSRKTKMPISTRSSARNEYPSLKAQWCTGGVSTLPYADLPRSTSFRSSIITSAKKTAAYQLVYKRPWPFVEKQRELYVFPTIATVPEPTCSFKRW